MTDLAGWIAPLVSAAGAVGLGGVVTRSEPMASHTSLQVGGPADLFVQVCRLDNLRDWVLLARRYGVPCLLLGNGTNILVGDAGIRGLVIANQCFNCTLLNGESGENSVAVRAESGKLLPALAQALTRQGWTGLEWAIGIPASVGAAVVNNAGAHGSCIADVLRSATVMDGSGLVCEWLPTEFEFDYRHSKLKGNHGRELVLAATFELQHQDPEGILTRMAGYQAHRRRTQPKEPSLGSVFKNPPDHYAGRLLDQAGLKGFQLGGAQVSMLHANWIVNTGSASATDVWMVILEMRRRVLEQFGIHLELEIEQIGEWPEECRQKVKHT